MAERKTLPKEELEALPIHVFTCGHKDCDKVDSMPHKDFMEHLQTIHAIDTKGLKAKKQAVAFLDGAGWFSHSYKVTLENGLECYEYYKGSTKSYK